MSYSTLSGIQHVDQCRDIVVQHMQHYRDGSSATTDRFHPFTKDAIESVLTECDFHPRLFLSRFNRILSRALSKGERIVNPDFINTVPREELDDQATLGIEDLIGKIRNRQRYCLYVIHDQTIYCRS